MRLSGGGKVQFFAMICGCILLATACAKVPSQKGFSYRYQPKMQSANHWQRLAENVVAKQIRPFFTNTAYNKPESIRGVYIEDKDRSAFGTAFETYLTTELFEKNIPVSASPADCFTIEWSVQKVVHNSKRHNPGPPAGIFGWIAYSVGSLFGADYYAYGNVPHSELLVTIKIKNENIVYSRNTETLYINDEDTQNYWVMPDKNTVVSHSFVREGSTVCRELSDLEHASEYDEQGNFQLKGLIKQRRCAITTKAYPVTIMEEKEDYVVIQSNEDPHYIYVTRRESIGG